LCKTGTSETLRNEITTTLAEASKLRKTKGTENIKNISIHNPKHLKPTNDNI